MQLSVGLIAGEWARQNLVPFRIPRTHLGPGSPRTLGQEGNRSKKAVMEEEGKGRGTQRDAENGR